MDSLSFLIENNNEVIIDEKLLHDLEKQQQPSEMTKKQSPKTTRKYSPMARPSRKSPATNKVTTKTESSKHIPNSKIFSQQQSIQILTSKIESLKQGQKEMQQKYSSVISTLRQQLNKRNTEYQRQCDEFNQVKNELVTTKKDIASLICLLKQNTTKQVDNSKRIQSPRGKGNILGHSKSNKNIL